MKHANAREQRIHVPYGPRRPAIGWRGPSLLPAAGIGIVEWTVRRLLGPFADDAGIISISHRDDGRDWRVQLFGDCRYDLRSEVRCVHYLLPMLPSSPGPGGAAFIVLHDANAAEWLDVIGGIEPTLVTTTAPGGALEFVYGFKSRIPGRAHDRLIDQSAPARPDRCRYRSADAAAVGRRALCPHPARQGAWRKNHRRGFRFSIWIIDMTDANDSHNDTPDAKPEWVHIRSASLGRKLNGASPPAAIVPKAFPLGRGMPDRGPLAVEWMFATMFGQRGGFTPSRAKRCMPPQRRRISSARRSSGQA